MRSACHRDAYLPAPALPDEASGQRRKWEQPLQRRAHAYIARLRVANGAIRGHLTRLLDLAGPLPVQSLVVVIEQDAPGRSAEQRRLTYGEPIVNALAELFGHLRRGPLSSFLARWPTLLLACYALSMRGEAGP